MNYPKEIKVFDKIYKIEYIEKAADVDPFKRESLQGSIDPWTTTIRIFKGDIKDKTNSSSGEIWHTIFHELVHAIGMALIIPVLTPGKDVDEAVVDKIALGITTILLDNNLLNVEGKK